MGIIAAELVPYPPLLINDTASNGGRINDATPLSSNVLLNLLPALTDAQALAGLENYRKLFFRLEDTEEGYMEQTGLYIGNVNSGDSELYLIQGTDTDVQSAVTGSNRVGSGTLDASITAGVNTIDVLVKDPAVLIFRDTETIRISDGVNTEYHVINGTPTIASSVITITTTANIANNFSIGTIVSSLIDYATVQTGVSGVTVTSGAGTFTDANVVVPNKGSIYQVWTLTFTSSTAFDLTGDTLAGSPIASGTVSTNFEPQNPNNLANYFEIPAGTLGGTFAASDTVVFTTDPATIPVWCYRNTPAGSSATANQLVSIGGYSLAA